MGDTSLWSFIVNADFIVKCVMIILLLASIASWTLIIQRMRLLKLRRTEAAEFEKRFWSGLDLSQLYSQLDKHKSQIKGLASIFHSGFSEYLKINQRSNTKSDTIIQGTQRAMRIAQSHEIDALEKHLSFLASVGSNSVYIGLFGTVWGIMSAFRGLGLVQQATLAMVAPGISEALIATAMGLIAAIPAVIAYNYFSSQLDRIYNSYETFQEEFSGILHHHVPSEEPS